MFACAPAVMRLPAAAPLCSDSGARAIEQISHKRRPYACLRRRLGTRVVPAFPGGGSDKAFIIYTWRDLSRGVKRGAWGEK
jgi:hypothetical protein